MKKLISASLAVILAVAGFGFIPPVRLSATTAQFVSKSSDGYVNSNGNDATANASWSKTYGGTGSLSVDTSSTTAIAGVSASFVNPVFLGNIYYGALIFDTSSIPAGASISSATIQLYVTNKQGTGNTYRLEAGTSSTYPHDPPTTADYGNALYNSTDCGTLAGSSITINTYNTWTLTSDGRSAIVPTGTTKFVLRQVQNDINNSQPSYSPSTLNYIQYDTYEAGSSFYPILNVTYTSAVVPTITTVAASSITDTTATLNGSITSDGGSACAVKWGYGTTSQTSANFASYDNVDGSFSGSYTTGQTPFKNVTSLSAGTTYYYRFQAQNSAGTVTSDERSFTTLTTPTITIQSASLIANTSARLNGSISSSGGELCQVRWGYGTTSESAGNFTSYDTVTSFSSAIYDSGSNPFYDATALTENTTYYFRFQAKNSIGTVTSDELSFMTTNAINAPTNFIGRPTATTIAFTWVLGAGSSQTMIRMKSTGYPTSTTDGIQVYFGLATAFTYTGLTPGTTYYFSIWGESGGDFSSPANALVTTGASTITTSAGAQMPTPLRWISAPNYTNLQNLPIVYDAVNSSADAINMPRATLWMLIAMFISGGAGILAYTGRGEAGGGARQSQIVGLAVTTGFLTFFWAIQIVPWFEVLLFLLWTILVMRAGREVS